MKPIAKNILAVVVGIASGMAVNMAVVGVGPSVVPLPEGADVSTVEKLSESMALFAPENFIFPFLAHALGTFAGAFVAAKLAGSQALKLAIGTGLWFMLGGGAMALLVGGPAWFNVCDLLLAYLPMGYLGGRLAGGKKRG
ncbi:MAG: hypothetical protein P8J87_12495 [Verrucomicrobiales bacterium]|nr:hypothetical protein [Verrucomicrobiales bacterium]